MIGTIPGHQEGGGGAEIYSKDENRPPTKLYLEDVPRCLVPDVNTLRVCSKLTII